MNRNKRNPVGSTVKAELKKAQAARDRSPHPWIWNDLGGAEVLIRDSLATTGRAPSGAGGRTADAAPKSL